MGEEESQQVCRAHHALHTYYSHTNSLLDHSLSFKMHRHTYIRTYVCTSVCVLMWSAHMKAAVGC